MYRYLIPLICLLIPYWLPDLPNQNRPARTRLNGTGPPSRNSSARKPMLPVPKARRRSVPECFPSGGIRPKKFEQAWDWLKVFSALTEDYSSKTKGFCPQRTLRWLHYDMIWIGSLDPVRSRSCPLQEDSFSEYLRLQLGIIMPVLIFKISLFKFETIIFVSPPPCF